MKIPLNVLHLEDDLRDRELVRETLEAEGIRCEIECVDTREAFVDALGRAGLDLILADYKLPSFDGLSALEIAKEKLRESRSSSFRGPLERIRRSNPSGRGRPITSSSTGCRA